MSDRIEKHIELNAPVSRVWRALTDHHEFGEWFRVKLDGPFRRGEVSHGQITYPGYEHLAWRATVQAIDPERLFSFTWEPLTGDPEVDDDPAYTTLVEFMLAPAEGGTALTLIESGFDRLPQARRANAFCRNEGGWTEQMVNIQRHVE